MSTDARPTPLLSGSDRREIVRDSIGQISSSQLATLCGVLQNLVVLRLVPPVFMGIWTTVRTLLDYGNYSSLGINRAAGLEIAVAAGRGDKSWMRRVADVAMSVELVTAALVAIGLLGGAVHHALRHELVWAVAFGVGAAAAVFSRYYAFNLSVLRSTKRFPAIARARVFGAVSELALFTAGAICFGFPGMLGAALLAQFVNVCYVRTDGGLRFTAAFDRPLAAKLLDSGWPMAAEALALVGLRSVDRFVILLCLGNGDEQLGWYKIAMVLGAWALDQSVLVSNVIYPRLAETLGRTNDPSAVVRLALRVAEIIALAMMVCTAGLVAAGVPLVSWLLPAYRPGLVAVAGLVSAAALVAISQPLRFALITVGRTRSVLVTTAISAAVSLAGGVALLHGSSDVHGAVLAFVAWNSAAAAAVCLAFVLVLCCWGRRELGQIAGRVVLFAACTVAGIVLLRSLNTTVVNRLAIACAWSCWPAWTLARRIDWRDLFSKRKTTGATEPDGADVA